MCDIDDRARWYVEDRRRARKPHWCDACCERIQPRHEYVRLVWGAWHTEIGVVKQCMRCHKIYKSLQAAKPGEGIAFALDCDEYIEDEDHPLQWLAFALPTDREVVA